jgi:hypothetical protein
MVTVFSARRKCERAKGGRKITSKTRGTADWQLFLPFGTSYRQLAPSDGRLANAMVNQIELENVVWSSYEGRVWIKGTQTDLVQLFI